MRLPNITLPSWLPRIILLVLSIIGWAMLVRVVVIMVAGSISLMGEDVGGLGVDTYAYWLAGANLAAGETLYFATSIDEIGAYFYPPPFAQAWIPASIFPSVVADWGWRLLGLLSIRYMAGSWMITGIWFLFPGTLVELTAGNVTFQVAALIVAALRGRAEGVMPAALVKFSSMAVIPFIWFRRPEARRGLVVGGAIAAGIVLVSVVADVGLWRDYVSALSSQRSLSFEGTTILHILPTAGADYLLRLGIAGGIVVASVRFNSPHLAFIAAVIATPTLWDQRLSVLFALLTLEGDRWLRPYMERRRDNAAAEPAGLPASGEGAVNGSATPGGSHASANSTS